MLCVMPGDLLLELLVQLPHGRLREVFPHDALLLLAEPRRERHRVRHVQVPLVLLQRTRSRAHRAGIMEASVMGCR